MDNFANIGKAVLVQSMGLQKNYIEVADSTIDVIDYNNTACLNCKWKAIVHSFSDDSEVCKAAMNHCQNCPYKQTTQQTVYKKIYHNEKNKYGYRPRLKSNAIKLLLLLHFYHPDRYGIIQDIDIRELATTLGCDIKTVRNNLSILTNYTYISISRTDTYTLNLCINDYENYYLPANKGGRGFFVLSKDLLEQLLKLNNILSLRVHLRELLDIDNLNAKGPFTAISKTYKELKLVLPNYCKPGIIRNSIKDQQTIFNISFKDNVIRFEINDDYNCRKQKSDCYNNYIQQFHDFIIEFNKTASYINVNNTRPEQFSTFFEPQELERKDHYRLITLKDYEIEDLAALAVQYSFDIVIHALSSIYKTYIMNERQILNLGGLIRTAIVAEYKLKEKAA